MLAELLEALFGNGRHYVLDWGQSASKEALDKRRRRSCGELAGPRVYITEVNAQ